MSGQAHPDDFDAPIQKRHQQIAEVAELHAAAALALAENPKDTKVRKTLEDLENERAAYERDIARLTAAKELAAQKLTAAGRAEAVRIAKERLSRATELRVEWEAALASLRERVWALAEPLNQLSTVGQDLYAACIQFVREARDLRSNDGTPGRLRRIVEGDQLAVGIIRELYQSGLGRTGIKLGSYVNIEPPGFFAGNKEKSIEELLQRDTEELFGTLRDLYRRGAGQDEATQAESAG